MPAISLEVADDVADAAIEVAGATTLVAATLEGGTVGAATGLGTAGGATGAGGLTFVILGSMGILGSLGSLGSLPNLSVLGSRQKFSAILNVLNPLGSVVVDTGAGALTGVGCTC